MPEPRAVDTMLGSLYSNYEMAPVIIATALVGDAASDSSACAAATACHVVSNILASDVVLH